LCLGTFGGQTSTILYFYVVVFVVVVVVVVVVSGGGGGGLFCFFVFVFVFQTLAAFSPSRLLILWITVKPTSCAMRNVKLIY
jgi:hypothetical protein